jgi:ribosomal protein L37AE/L43A
MNTTRKEYLKVWRKQYYLKNKEKDRQYYIENRDHILEVREKYVENNHDKVLESKRAYNKSITVTKRCPKCNKNVTLRKDYKIVVCRNCGTRISIRKTLSESIKNTHGIKLKVASLSKN